MKPFPEQLGNGEMGAHQPCGVERLVPRRQVGGVERWVPRQLPGGERLVPIFFSCHTASVGAAVACMKKVVIDCCLAVTCRCLQRSL